jgi:c-di-GMP-binding flagellar brake protein YcgR
VDKRRYPRIDLVFDLKVTRSSEDPDATVSVIPLNVSACGVSFKCNTPLTEGSSITVNLAFPEISGEIVTDARVVRIWNESDGYYAAVEFVSIQDDDRLIIDEYINYYEEGVFNE